MLPFNGENGEKESFQRQTDLKLFAILTEILESRRVAAAEDVRHLRDR